MLLYNFLKINTNNLNRMKAPKMRISLNSALMLISSLVMISDIEIMNKVSAQTLVASTSCASGYYFNSATLN